MQSYETYASATKFQLFLKPFAPFQPRPFTHFIMQAGSSSSQILPINHRLNTQFHCGFEAKSWSWPSRIKSKQQKKEEEKVQQWFSYQQNKGAAKYSLCPWRTRIWPWWNKHPPTDKLWCYKCKTWKHEEQKCGLHELRIVVQYLDNNGSS